MMDRIPCISAIEIYTVRLPLVKPFQTSFAIRSHKEALLLRLLHNDIHGWGECVASVDPYYSYETNKTAYHIIKDFMAPILKTKKDFTVEEILCVFSRIRGHNMAKAAIENALLDLVAKIKGVPLYNLIGGKSKKIMSGISIGIKESIADLQEAVQQALDKKYHRIKIKIKKGKDVEIIRAIRQRFADINLMVDANSAYSIEDKSIIKQFDKYNLMMIEQPLYHDDLYFHSILQKELKTSICLDESIKNLNDTKTAIQFGSCRIVNIKQGRVGGLLNSKVISEYCMDNGIKTWSGGMLETGIGRAFNIHLQTLPAFVLPGDTSETQRYFKEDIVDKPVELDADGFIDVPDGIGIGVQVVFEKLNRFKVFYEKL